jgi:prepilin-type N-terminal cleavage/methylation domain-containing protein/prepilin-type processing-associated H-X9-DG protein
MFARPVRDDDFFAPGSSGIRGVQRTAFTIIELLVAVAILATLAGLLLPAIDSAREASRATMCRHRLRSLALATMQFQSIRDCFPPARLVPPAEDKTARIPSPTWLIRVMPFLEQDATDWLDGKSYADQSEPVRGRVVPDFLCPTRRDATNAVTPSARSPDQLAACGCFIPGRFVTGGAVADFGGNHGHQPPAAGTQGAGSGLIVSAEHVPGTSRWKPWLRQAAVIDGLGHTVLIGEMHVPRDGLCRPPANGPAYDATEFFNMSRVGGVGVPLGDGPLDDVAGMGMFAFGSWHPGACHFAFADGRVQSLAPTISADLLASLCDRADATP